MPVAKEEPVNERVFVWMNDSDPKELEAPLKESWPGETVMNERVPADVDAAENVSCFIGEAEIVNAREPEDEEAAERLRSSTRRRVNWPEDVDAPEKVRERPGLTASIWNDPGAASGASNRANMRTLTTEIGNRLAIF